LIQKHASALNIPLFYFHSVGYYAHFSVQLPRAFPIVDTHPDSTAIDDLRVLKPWPELLEFSQEKTNGVESMSAHDKGHIPYVCLLLHYVNKWMAENDGKLPEAYKDKTAVRNMIRADGGDEENFEEAYGGAQITQPSNGAFVCSCNFCRRRNTAPHSNIGIVLVHR
jgi:amyloid beta precursor protein binding protein 1